MTCCEWERHVSTQSSGNSSPAEGGAPPGLLPAATGWGLALAWVCGGDLVTDGRARSAESLWVSGAQGVPVATQEIVTCARRCRGLSL